MGRTTGGRLPEMDRIYERRRYRVGRGVCRIFPDRALVGQGRLSTVARDVHEEEAENACSYLMHRQAPPFDKRQVARIEGRRV